MLPGAYFHYDVKILLVIPGQRGENKIFVSDSRSKRGETNMVYRIDPKIRCTLVKCGADSSNYSNHLNTGRVRYSNGQKLSGLQMVLYSNGI